VYLLDMSTEWKKKDGLIYEGKDRKSGAAKWTASQADLAFGSNPELRALAEKYAQSDNKKLFVDHFVKAWAKVMNLDRYDIIDEGESSLVDGVRI